MQPRLRVLGVGAFFGLGAALVSVAVAVYFPHASGWLWHAVFWGGAAVAALLAMNVAFPLRRARPRAAQVASPPQPTRGPAAPATGEPARLAPARLAPARLAPARLAIDCRCEMMPAAMPAREPYHFLQAAGGGLRPDADSSRISGLRCQMTNDGSAAVVKLAATVHVIFSEALPRADLPGGFAAGATVSVTDYEIAMTRLDPGTDAACAFHLFNLSPWLIELSLPDTITVQRPDDDTGGEDTGGTTPLTRTPQGRFFLAPFDGATA